MVKRKAAPKDDAVEGGAPQEAPENSVYIGKSLKPESSRNSSIFGSPIGTG